MGIEPTISVFRIANHLNESMFKAYSLIATIYVKKKCVFKI